VKTEITENCDQTNRIQTVASDGCELTEIKRTDRSPSTPLGIILPLHRNAIKLSSARFPSGPAFFSVDAMKKVWYSPAGARIKVTLVLAFFRSVKKIDHGNPVF
jgi:hypothetical protein